MTIDRRLWMALTVGLGATCLLCFLTAAASVRLSALSQMAIVEEEQACGRILESGLVDRSEAARTIPGLPAALHAAPSPVGYIPFHRFFFEQNALSLTNRQSLYCAAFAGIAGSLSLAGFVLLLMLRRP